MQHHSLYVFIAINSSYFNFKTFKFQCLSLASGSKTLFLILLSVVFIHCQYVYLPSQTIIVGSSTHGIDIDNANKIMTFATYDPFFKIYKNDGTTFSKINQLNPGDDGENVDVTPDGKFIFATTYGTSYPNKLFEYIDSSTGYSVIQDIKTGSVYSYSGFISDDSQIIGVAANNSINIKQMMEPTILRSHILSALE